MDNLKNDAYYYDRIVQDLSFIKKHMRMSKGTVLFDNIGV